MLIYNSLFKKSNDKRIVMKKYIEKKRKNKLTVMNQPVSPTKRKKRTVHKDSTSSPSYTPFIKKQTLPPNRWGDLKEISPSVEVSVQNSQEMLRIKAIRRDLEDLSRKFSRDGLTQFKKLIGVKEVLVILCLGTHFHLSNICRGLILEKLPIEFLLKLKKTSQNLEMPCFSKVNIKEVKYY